LPEIAQDRISSVRVKFDPYQDCFNSSGASQSEDRNDKQKTGFLDSIDCLAAGSLLRIKTGLKVMAPREVPDGAPGLYFGRRSLM
jgi:hypothetical protein